MTFLNGLLRRALSCFGLLLVGNSAEASALLDQLHFEHWYLDATLGQSASHITEGTSTVLPAVAGLAPEAIADTQNSSNAATYSLSIGGQFAILHARATGWLAYYRLGLRYQNQRPEKLTGIGSWSGYANMTDVDNYTYQAQSQILLLDTALGLYQKGPVSTFLHLASGVAITKASAYSETAGTDLPGKPSYGFADQTTSTWVGDIGLGVDCALTKNWQLFLAYDYFTPVRAQLGAGTALNYATPSGPQTNLSNQSTSLGVRYSF